MPRFRSSRGWINLISGAGVLGAASLTIAAPPPPRFGPAKPPAMTAPVQTVSQTNVRRTDATTASQRRVDATTVSQRRVDVNAQNQSTTIDLASALDLAGVRNPQIMMARERVTETAAIRQFAAAQILPNLNGGMNFDAHSGPLQQSSGHILDLSRSALYVGAGANAIAAGSVNIPGVMWNQNISQGIYTYLVARQTVRRSEFQSQAVRNDVLKRVALAYVELLRASGRRAIAIKIRDDAAEIARLTAAYARTGQGRQADADRAATELGKRETDLMVTEGELLMASSRLAQLLNLDPLTRLQPAEGWVVPTPLVPEQITLQELIGIAALRRPELAAQRQAIAVAMLNLQGARVLPFSPTTLVGFSAGLFGGGSNLQPQRFGNFGGRNDFDVIAYWTLQNMGVGNRAQINVSRSRLRQSDLERLDVLNAVRLEVANAYVRAQTRFTQIATAERAVRTGIDSFNEDMIRTKNNEGLPIEVLDSLRLLGRARFEYLDSIAEYNASQFELYVALGQPPANALARPANGAEQGAPTEPDAIPEQGPPPPEPPAALD
jgi:outer membrane protein TolC